MKITPRATIALTGLLASVLAVGATPASAKLAADREAPFTRGAQGALVVRLPASTPDASIAAPPTTSPAPARSYHTTGSSYTCSFGYVCAAVPYAGGFEIFDFYSYATYTLSNWYGVGAIVNNQTGSATAKVFDGNWVQAFCLTPSQWRYPNWTPYWYIRLTTVGC